MTRRYDSSLSPALDWDGQNSARELGEWLLAQIDEASKLEPPHKFAEPRQMQGVYVAGLADAVSQLKSLSGPFLDWSGKAERVSFDVATLPLFVHERLSTKAILQTLRGHERDRQVELQLFADPQLPLHEQLEAYEHRGDWVNRLILGDSAVVMNSLLQYEGLGGQIQMVYVDPPYGVDYNSNFQPFVRNRDVVHGRDDQMTREPEMVRAYRDTWSLGLHSYLTFLRDRLLIARELLMETGSIFVQINDEHVHYVRSVLDEVFGSENFISQITFSTTTGFSTKYLSTLGDYVLWYGKDKERTKVNKIFREQPPVLGKGNAKWVLMEDGSYRGVTAAEKRGEQTLPEGARLYSPDNLKSQGASSAPQPFHFGDRSEPYTPGRNSHWKANYPEGMNRLGELGRIHVASNSIRYRRFATDFAYVEVGNFWTDTSTGNFTEEKLYVVKTPDKVVERCILLTTDPGDLILDPTCGGGTTPHLAEQWGRRWIAIDASRVPMALTRQGLLTATYPYFELQDDSRGPSAGFVYKRRQNRKGEEVGGIVPHITLESLANDEPPEEEVLIDRPEVLRSVTRVSGPFAVEATIPTPVEDSDHEGESLGVSDVGSHVDRMLEALRRSSTLRLPGNRTVTLSGVRAPGQALVLSGEASMDPDGEPTAIVFGPEHGAVSERLVYEAASEARMKQFTYLLVVGFAVEPGARTFIEKIENLVGIKGVYVQASPDLVMGDLLKTMRSSQLFSVSGLPDVTLRKLAPEEKGGSTRYQVEVLGLDTFDPSTFETEHRDGEDVPAWFLDTAWNGMSFHVSQAFFPRTSAWSNLAKSLGTEFDDSVWEHLSGTVSSPFTEADSREIAVKVIDDRGNELVVVKSLDEAL